MPGGWHGPQWLQLQWLVGRAAYAASGAGMAEGPGPRAGRLQQQLLARSWGRCSSRGRLYLWTVLELLCPHTGSLREETGRAGAGHSSNDSVGAEEPKRARTEVVSLRLGCR